METCLFDALQLGLLLRNTSSTVGVTLSHYFVAPVYDCPMSYWQVVSSPLVSLSSLLNIRMSCCPGIHVLQQDEEMESQDVPNDDGSE